MSTTEISSQSADQSDLERLKIELRYKELENEKEAREHERQMLELRSQMAAQGLVAGNTLNGDQPSHHGSTTSLNAGATGRSEKERQLGYFTKLLNAVIPAPPRVDVEMPIWFDGVDSIFETYNVPYELMGSIILPKLIARIPYIINRLDRDLRGDYNHLKEVTMTELQLSSAEYLSLFLTASKRSDENWPSFATRVETYFEFYLTSREADDREAVKFLMVSDQIKRKMDPSAREFIELKEGGTQWLKPQEIAGHLQDYDAAK